MHVPAAPAAASPSPPAGLHHLTAQDPRSRRQPRRVHPREFTANGELILTDGSGNGYRFAELMGASNPSGWSGVLTVKTPAGATLGYILLYTNS